jgi:glycine/D-amino acid oxidase-like deaminating enzyme
MRHGSGDAVVVGACLIGLTTAVQLAEAGWSVPVLARELPAQGDAARHAPVVVNATGLVARDLAADTSLTAIRGQR